MNNIKIYTFYNNKGGVGKTTLCSNAATLYAKKHPNTQVLVIDMCPQANISQFLLGGGRKGYENNQKLQSSFTRRNIVGFIDWLLKGNANFRTPKTSYKVQISPYNSYITNNLYLIAGDSFLESFSLALNYAVINPANTKAWLEYMTAIKRLCVYEFAQNQYENMVVFIDCNPSFSIYTQMALVSSDKLVIPMMADFSSLEGIKGLFMLLFGKYPSAALKKYADDVITFNKQVDSFNLQLPVIWEFVFNNYTIKHGVAAAFESIKTELNTFCYEQFQQFPLLFAKCDPSPTCITEWEKCYVSGIKDFHTSGKVSSSLGIPMFLLPNQSKYAMPNGRNVKLPTSNYEQALQEIEKFVDKLS
ncbi:ParA family protein [Planktothrix sp. FACHB-1355]|uniref:ParA family protein n=1 Tax=Aerosakkonema funiforme FACHB-1375 TaxID=2949571 RepID=A0A926V9S0_9CYAN|nr:MULTISPECIES: ParA family protein [Oscillatoriales]MBD2179816.1 ParA family protein [Aerosakkonema funiforme FACHB-1375]MBD3557923.1 ParA family protein [Planktothrix sp. FACHB-1355]